MQDITKSAEYRQQKQLLSKNSLLTPRIQPEIVEGIERYQKVLMKKLKQAIMKQNYSNFFASRIKIIMDVFKKEHKEKSLIYVIKKCAFLHMFLHQGCSSTLIPKEDVDLIMNQVNEIIQVDIPRLGQEKQAAQTSRNSIQKLYNYIRGKSQSRKIQKSKSKLKMESTSDKGAIKQLTYRVVTPFCSYFLKIAQDFCLYSQILRNKVEASEQEEVRWKIMNYLGHLCKIVTEFNRLAKYYKQDLAGCWVLLYYIMSTDITIYANVVGQQLATRCQQWNQKIILMEKIGKISKSHRLQLKNALENQQFVQLVKQIELILQYKQKLLYLYFNAQLKSYLCFFIKPELVTKKSKYSQPFEFILCAAAKFNPNISAKKNTQFKEREQKDGQVRKTGETIKKRLNSLPTQLISQFSTIESTSRERVPIQKPIEQKLQPFAVKKSQAQNFTRQNNFISQAKGRAMGK